MSSTCRCKIAQCPHGLRHDLIIITIITCYSCPKRQGAAADKLLTKAAKIVILVGRARSKQDPINHGFSVCIPSPRQPGSQTFNHPNMWNWFSLQMRQQRQALRDLKVFGDYLESWQEAHEGPCTFLISYCRADCHLRRVASLEMQEEDYRLP